MYSRFAFIQNQCPPTVPNGTVSNTREFLESASVDGYTPEHGEELGGFVEV